jgi:hypothetical protein
MPDQKTRSDVQKSESSQAIPAASSDSLNVQSLEDPLADPLADPLGSTTQLYGGGPSVAAAGAPGGNPGSPWGSNSSAVMFKGGGAAAAGIHQQASKGVSGAGGALPHGDTIQKSFGSHDVSSVQAHTGGAAASANQAMGSKAYATGNQVAFKSASPDLHTAAHEAAHVVQQQSGVSLPGGVGSAGDSYERHADSVADSVVQGKSAAPLLNSFVGGARAATVQHSAAVQHMGLFERIGRGIGKGMRAVGNFFSGTSAGQAAFEEAEIFVNHGKYGPELYTPPTGVGGFDVEYHPFDGPNGWERAMIDCAVNFISPVKMAGKKAAATEAGDDPSKKLAAAINKKPEAQRPGLVAKYTWGGEKSGFLTKIESQVFQAWSYEHSFRVDKVGWKWVGADVSVNVDAREGEKKDDEHLQIKLYKVNEDPGSLTEGRDMPAWEWKTGRDQLMRIDSGDFQTNPAPTTQTIEFNTPGDIALTDSNWDSGSNDWLEKFNSTYMGDPTSAASAEQQVVITAGGAATGRQTLAESRADAVYNYLLGKGWPAGRMSKVIKGQAKDGNPQPADPHTDRKVVMTLPGTGQTTVAHEFGHAFGLKDEYANKDKDGNAGWISGTGGQAGAETGHSELARRAGVEAGAIYENSENMMSVGNTVKPQHYATFHDALCKLTAFDGWKLGKAISKQAARAEAIPENLDGQKGDFNVPTGDTRLA